MSPYYYNVQPMCDAPVNGSMETGGGLRLCCNPAHRLEPDYESRGPVWHRIAEWPAEPSPFEKRIEAHKSVPDHCAKPPCAAPNMCRLAGVCAEKIPEGGR